MNTEEQTMQQTESGTADIDLVEAEETPARTGPWDWMPDWLEHWRPMFGRRMPELLAEMRLPDALFEESMRVEEHRDGDTIVVRVEIPGVDPEKDIEVTVDDGTLTISAEREQREETKTDDSFRSEFRYGSFRRSRSVPPGTKLEDVQATYEDGILEVRVPVADTAEAVTKIPVTRKH